MTYEKLREREFKYLSAIKLNQYLIKKANIYNIMVAISNDHSEAFKKKYKNAEPLFTYITNIDFIEYLEKEYKTEIVQEVRWVIR